VVALLVIGALLMAGSVLVGLVVACDHYGACFLPSDPAVGAVGFSTAPDGGTLLVLAPTPASQTVDLEAFGPADASATSSPQPVWRIERTGATAPAWDGTVEIGAVPAGFRETIPLTIRPDEVRAVLATNG
jgi:hypothetical protein